MDSIDFRRRERQARLKYEWARLRRAAFGFAPALLLVAAAALASKHPKLTIAFGSALFVVGIGLLWHGQRVRRAVLPGLAMGLLPLALALCANHMGHMCTGDGCMTLCVPACVAGGLGAGIGISVIGHRQQQGVGFWIAASVLALLTGAMGCTCVGYYGVVGLALGYGVGFSPALIRRLVR